MSERDLMRLLERGKTAAWRVGLARRVESGPVQRIIVAAILVNGVVLGMETSDRLMDRWGMLLEFVDRLCLAVFLVELAAKLAAYRGLFWRSGWNLFDFLVVAVAVVPGSGPWAVLRSLRILRVLRLLTVVPQLRRVVAAFFHAIPGLSGVMLVMAVFYYAMAVLATNLFGDTFPQWFGTLGASLFSLFQIMTLESWSMGIVRPILEVHPWAWAFFVPFIVIATFTILNLFIGIIVSTMQELSVGSEESVSGTSEAAAALARIERELAVVRSHLDRERNH